MINKHGEFIWYELCTPDADGAQSFYSAVIGWDIADSLTPDMDYRIVHATDDENGERVPVGALAQLSDEMQVCGAQPVWLGYIAVDDVDASVNRIVAAGRRGHDGQHSRGRAGKQGCRSERAGKLALAPGPAQP